MGNDDNVQMKAITLMHRPSTGSSFRLDIPKDVMKEAEDILSSDLDWHSKKEECLVPVLAYIAENMPNAGEWEMDRGRLFSFVPVSDGGTGCSPPINGGFDPPLDLPPKFPHELEEDWNDDD